MADAEPQAPQPDSRWDHLVGDFQILGEVTESWTRPIAAPDHIDAMLRTTREPFQHAYYVYDFLGVAHLYSLVALEAALRDAVGASAAKGAPGFRRLARMARDRGLIDDDGHRLLDEAGAELRNRAVHVERAPLLTPGMAAGLLARTHQLVASLYDRGDQAQE